MFVKYQTVRNTLVVATAAIVAGVGFLFSRGNEDTSVSQPQVPEPHTLTSTSDPVEEFPVSDSPSSSQAEIEPSEVSHATSLIPLTQSTHPATPKNAQENEPVDRDALLRNAMAIASTAASSSGKGKDVLGAESPWKLNLYDDDRDGQWDRGKLDYDRDEVDDENWTFKKGRWEKDGGRTIWDGTDWIAASSVKSDPVKSGLTEADENLQRYRVAMQLASRPAVGGKGKDVLGPASPWKLNLYDDNKDGQWDRGKLDYDRDEVDDEKWNFKNGRWEKDGGATIWDGQNWIAHPRTKSSSAQSANLAADSIDPKLARYRAAMRIATVPAARSGKDVLGPSSPWKLNLYDDDKDGQWDRGKLDYERDEVDDEKWNFKDGRWEKDGGKTIWNGSDWIPSGK